MKFNYKELRMGNWIDFISTPGEYEKVLEIKSGIVNHIKSSDVIPIPLMETFIFDAGFKKIENKLSIYRLEEFQLFANFNKKGDLEERNIMLYKEYSKDKDYCFIKSIFYVHQLQNIWFDLTDEELNINPYSKYNNFT